VRAAGEQPAYTDFIHAVRAITVEKSHLHQQSRLLVKLPDYNSLVSVDH
jgi:hypothetical protein